MKKHSKETIATLSPLKKKSFWEATVDMFQFMWFTEDSHDIESLNRFYENSRKSIFKKIIRENDYIEFRFPIWWANKVTKFVESSIEGQHLEVSDEDNINLTYNGDITLVGTPVAINLDYIIEEESELSHVDDNTIFENLDFYGETRQLAKSITLKDYLVLYEMNDKAMLSIYNAITGNLLFFNRIDYLNVDPRTGLMNPLSNCIIHEMLDVNTLIIALDKRAELYYLTMYDTEGCSKTN